MRMNNLLSPKHLVYILAHALIFIIGLMLVLINPSNSLLAALGISLVSAGIAGWVIFVYILVSQSTNKKLDILTKFGFENAFEGRSVRIKEEYDKRIGKAHNIDIMGFGLRALRQDYKDQFKKWKTHANVRILLVDPSFPNDRAAYSTQRDIEEDNSVGTIKTDVNEFISACNNLLDDRTSNKFEVRLYKCLPSINIFRIDDELFWGPYLMKEQSRNSPTFLVKRGGILYEHMLKHFDNIWTDGNMSRPITTVDRKVIK